MRLGATVKLALPRGWELPNWPVGLPLPCRSALPGISLSPAGVDESSTDRWSFHHVSHGPCARSGSRLLLCASPCGLPVQWPDRAALPVGSVLLQSAWRPVLISGFHGFFARGPTAYHGCPSIPRINLRIRHRSNSTPVLSRAQHLSALSAGTIQARRGPFFCDLASLPALPSSARFSEACRSQQRLVSASGHAPYVPRECRLGY